MPDGQQDQGEQNSSLEYSAWKWCIRGLLTGAGGSGIGTVVALVIELVLGLPKKDQWMMGAIAFLALKTVVSDNVHVAFILKEFDHLGSGSSIVLFHLPLDYPIIISMLIIL